MRLSFLARYYCVNWRILLFFTCFSAFSCSTGDRSSIYRHCVNQCKILNCTIPMSGSSSTLPLSNSSTFDLFKLLWPCPDECHYQCMWLTVEKFKKMNWGIPQFYGKWPFYRYFGLQEPLSCIFSLLNLIGHLIMLKKFMSHVKSTNSMYKVWIGFGVVCAHAWVWSAIFHARDTRYTEFLDYASAFSIILVNCYVMLARFKILSNSSLSILMFSIFFYHAWYLSGDKIDYGYNMKVNITIGTLTAIGWLIWSYFERHQNYMWKIVSYIILTGAVLLLELIDRPPMMFYTIDCHSLWHLSTAPLIYLIYSFAIDDCNYLAKSVKIN